MVFFKIKITRKVKQSFHCVCEGTKFRMVRNIILHSLWGKSEIKGLVCENNKYKLMCPCSGAKYSKTFSIICFTAEIHFKLRMNMDPGLSFCLVMPVFLNVWWLSELMSCTSEIKKWSYYQGIKIIILCRNLLRNSG